MSEQRLLQDYLNDIIESIYSVTTGLNRLQKKLS
jgi:hypothetical protein